MENIERLNIMQVSIPNGIYESSKNYNIKQFSQNNLFTSQMKNDSISFGSTEGLIYLVARSGWEVLKNGPQYNNFINYKKELNTVIWHPKEHSNKLIDTILALSNTPDEQPIEKKWLFEFMSQFKDADLIRFGDLKMKALEDIFPIISDNFAVVREAKKQLMTHLCDNRGVNYYFINAFKDLPDVHYKNYKELIVDKVLYSKDYNKNHGSSVYNKYFSMDLISKLDPITYHDYLKKNYNEIVKLKQIVFENIQDHHLNLHKRNGAYCSSDGYSHNFGLRAGNHVHSNCIRTFFYAIIENCNYDKNKICEALNIDDIYAEDILKDINIHNVVNTNNSMTIKEKRNIYKQRITEKISNQSKEIAMSSITLCAESNMTPNILNCLVPLVDRIGHYSWFELSELLKKYGDARHTKLNDLVEDSYSIWS